MYLHVLNEVNSRFFMIIASVVLACCKDAKFKRDVSQLALDTVCQETKVQAEGIRAHTASNYIGRS